MNLKKTLSLIKDSSMRMTMSENSRCRSLGFGLVVSTVLSSANVSGQAVDFRNTGSFEGRPELHADTFYNNGLFEIDVFTVGTEIIQAGGLGFVLLRVDAPPFSPFGTSVYTNDSNGRIVGSFQFDNKTEGLERTPAEKFLNRGLIEGRRSILVSAEEIVNEGIIDSGAGGKIELYGEDIDLSRGGLRASTPGEFTFGGFDFQTNHLNPVGVFDVAWGVGTNGVFQNPQNGFQFDASGLGYPIFFGPPHEVTNSFSFLNPSVTTLPITTPVGVDSVTEEPLTNFSVSVFTNSITETNTIVQVCYFRTNFTDTLTKPLPLTSEVRWSPNGLSAVPIVKYELTELDIVSGTNVVESVFVEDLLMQTRGTNLFLSQNLASTNNFKPNASVIHRRRGQMEPPPFNFAMGGPGVLDFTPELFTLGFADTLASNWVYSAYVADIERPGPVNQIVSFGQAVDRPIETLSSTPSNLLGRIKIDGDRVNLSRARIRAENFLEIKANEFVGDVPQGIDSRIFDLDLISSEEEIELANVVPAEVLRFTGQMQTFSAVWTNISEIITTAPDPMTGEDVATTNNVQTAFHVFMVDPEFNFVEPTSVENLSITGISEDDQSIEIRDQMNVNGAFRLEAESVSIRNGLNVPGSLTDDMFVGTRNFELATSDGTIFLGDQGVINLGAPDREPALDTLSVIGGARMAAPSVSLGANELNLGSAAQVSSTFGDMTLRAESLRISDAAVVSTSGNLFLRGDTVELSDYFLGVGDGGSGRLFLDASTSLTDEGIGGEIVVTDGFEMVVVPAESGSLGTTLMTSQIPRFRRVTHIWGGEDRGPNPAGFENNLALDTLAFRSVDAFGEIALQGTDESPRAIYVRFLELLGPVEANFEQMFDIDENFTIYFEEVFSETGLLTNADVDGAYGGRFRQVETVDEALSSEVVATDVSVSASLQSTGEIQLTIEAAAGASYSVERADSLAPGAEWVVVDVVTNDANSGVTLVVSDLVGEDVSEAYYRVAPIQE